VLSRRLHGTPAAATTSKTDHHDSADPVVSSFRLLTVSAGLSIALFSISVLELMPSTFILWIKGDAILWVYHFVLWGMVLHCFLLVPTACFMAVAQHIRPPSCTSSDPDDEEHKKRSFRRKHWVHVLLYRPIIVVLGTLLQMVLCLVDPCLRGRGTSMNHASSATLPLTVNATSSISNGTTATMGNSPSSSSTTANNHAKPTWTWRSWYYECTNAYCHPTMRKRILFGTILTSSCTYVALSRIRPWVIHISDEVRLEESLFQIAISSLCAVGILLSACLNGFGSVSLPYTCLLGFVLHPVSDEAIRNAEKELEAVRSRLGGLLEQQQPSLRGVRRNASLEKDTFGSGDLRGMRRNISTDGTFATIDLETAGSDDGVLEQYPDYRRKAQVDFFLSLIADIVADIEEMKYVKTWSTKRGIVRRAAGVVCSAILLVRLGTALLNVCFPSHNVPTSSSSPFLALVLAHATRSATTIYTDDYNAKQTAVEQQQQLAQVLSVFLTAILSATQLQTFVVSASALQRRMWSSCCGGCPQQQPPTASVPAPMTRLLMLWTHHTVGWLLCCYSLACVVLTKQMMGSEIDDTSEHLYLKFHIDRYTVDLTYGASAILSVAVLAIVLGIMRANSQRYVNDAAAAVASTSPRGMVEV
jgi:hypothetical protein